MHSGVIIARNKQRLYPCTFRFESKHSEGNFILVEHKIINRSIILDIKSDSNILTEPQYYNTLKLAFTPVQT